MLVQTENVKVFYNQLIAVFQFLFRFSIQAAAMEAELEVISLSPAELHYRHHYQQWPQFANAAASSGFQQQIRTPPKYLQKNGFNSLMRPS